MVTATLLLPSGMTDGIEARAYLMASEAFGATNFAAHFHSREDLVLREDPYPGDVLLNFLSSPKVTRAQLSRFALAINFHPAGPEYPGIGWASRMIHDKVRIGGATAHVMTEDFDAGPILSVRRYVVDPAWGYKALAARAYKETLSLFQEWVARLSIEWSGPAMTRAEFEKHPSFTEVAP